MATETNGRVIDPLSSSSSNKASMKNVLSTRSSRSRSANSKSIVGRLFSTGAWILTWYSIITILLRCPQSPADLIEDSPRLCKPYFQARDVISPHISPYYDTYAAAYVDTAKPYVAPAVDFVGKKYGVYGAPLVEKSKVYGQEQWEKSIHPQILSSANGAKQQYDAVLAPHVERVNVLAQPYLEKAKENMLQTYYSHVLPTYAATRPYAEHAYAVGNDFALKTGIPYARWAGSTAAVFVNRTIWPRIRVLYGENVEPQVVRIVERLGRYRDGRKVKAAVKDVDGSSASSKILSISSSVAADYASGSTKTKATTTASKSLTPKQQEAEARREIAADLKRWQDKFAKAASKGGEDLEVRLQDITQRQINSQVDGVGGALIVQLEETAKDELLVLKAKIVSIVQSLPGDSPAEDAERAENDVALAVRAAGVSIKTKAQALRAWKHEFVEETFFLVSAATNSTLEVIDNIRDLGLQEIGMKWAWMEGVTYKDWSEYHTLKKSFDDKRNQVESIAKDYKGLAQVQDAGDEIESKGMAIATEAANELKRLKEVGKWKIHARDSSDDFSTRYAPAAAAKAGQKILDKVSEVSEAAVGTSQGTMESVISQASASAADVASSASSKVVGTKPGKVEEAASKLSDAVIGTETPVVESIASKASSNAAQAKKAVSSAVLDPVEQAIGDASKAVIDDHQQPIAKSVVSEASSKVGHVASQASQAVVGSSSGAMEEASSKISEAIIGSKQPAGESVISAASKKVKDAASGASSVVIGTPAPAHESSASQASESISSLISDISGVMIGDESPPSDTSSIVDSVSSSASSVASAASKKVWGGASAQRVDARKIVYEDVIEDDDSAFSLKIQSIASQAGDRYADITNAVSQALIKPTSTQGNVESVTSLASAQYASALLAASEALYGTEQGTGESIASVASGKYAQAVAAASSAIYGTPIPAAQAASISASSAYDVAYIKAKEQYSHAVSIVSEQISGPRKPVHEEMFSSIESAYSGALVGASQRLQEALVAASAGIYGTAPSAQESVLAAAKAKYSEALNGASSQYEQARIAISGSPKPAHESLLSVAASKYSDLSRAADSQFASITAAASTAVYGKPQGALESISSVASVKLAEGLGAASAQYENAKEVVKSQPPPMHQRYSAEAQRRYYEGVGLAHERYSEFIGAASIAIYGTPTPVHQSLYNAASTAIYGTPAPAYESLVSAAQIQYSEAVGAASSGLQIVLASASSVAGKKKKSPAESILSAASSKYDSIVSVASVSLSSASLAASTAVYGQPTGSIESIASAISEKAGSAASIASTHIVGSETPWTESVASAASQNWEELVSKASRQVYGTPTPFSESVLSHAGQYAAQATDGAILQYEAMSALISDLVIGKEPDFTESVMSQFSSAWYTDAGGLASSASNYANEAYNSASSLATAFTPPPALEYILSAASDSVNSAVEAASIQIYGTTKGTYESATSAAASAYGSVQSKASEAIYGSQTGYAEAAQSSISDVAASAQSAMSVAIYGTSTGIVESAGSAAQSAYSSATDVAAKNAASVSNVASEKYDAAASYASTAVYGPEQNAFESAQSRLGAAVESARAQLAEYATAAGEGASEAINKAREGVEEMASSVSSAIKPSKKDEL